MVLAHVLVILFEVVISIVIPISRTVVLRNFTFPLLSAPDRVVIAYFRFKTQQMSRKLESKMSLIICTRN